MNEILAIVLFFLGFILILKGGDLMVESTVWLAQITKIPSMIIGATVVSIATTFPETTVAFLASLSNQEQLALNTSIGSIICNFTMVLGLSFAFMPTKIDASALFKRSIFFGLVLIIIVIFSLDLIINLFEGICLLVFFVVFLLFNIVQAKREQTGIPSQSDEKRPGLLVALLQFSLSTIAIGYGASVLVDNIGAISQFLGLSEQVVGLSLIAFGTNIPEIVTTIASIKKKTPEIGIGNIFGASVINATLLIGGATVLASERRISFSKTMLFINIPLMFLVLFIVTYPIVRKGRSARLQGILLLLIYIIYSVGIAFLL